MTASEPDLVAVGRIGPAHGLRGAVLVLPWTDDPADRFAAGRRLRTDPPTSGPLTIRSAHDHSGRLLVQFDGVADRAAATALRGVVLLIESRSRPALPDPDEFYDTDLIGLQASTVDGRALGPISEVVHGPGGDHLVVRVADREVLVPFVAAIVPDVDLTAGTVHVDPPDGLLEL
jgi:16S rRNA processing protein RimM